MSVDTINVIIKSVYTVPLHIYKYTPRIFVIGKGFSSLIKPGLRQKRARQREEDIMLSLPSSRETIVQSAGLLTPHRRTVTRYRLSSA